MARFAAAFHVVSALLLSGCANYAISMRTNAPVAAGDAFFYGHFFIDAPKEMLSLGGHDTMGFKYVCNTGTAYTVGFSNDTPLQVIKIKPGRCHLAEIVFTSEDGFIASTKQPHPDLMKDFAVEPGVAYYLGDFHAVSQTSHVGTGTRTMWALDRVENRFEDRTAEMKTTYKNLASIRTANHLMGTGPSP